MTLRCSKRFGAGIITAVFSSFFLFFLFNVSAVHAASFTSTQSGNLNSSATWGGGGAPNCSGGDTITVSSGDTVTINVDCTLGSNATSVGNAFTVNGVSSSSYGTLVLPAGVTLTLRGYDASSNLLGEVDQYGLFDAQASSTVVADLAGDYGSVIKVNGNITAAGATFTIPSANIIWNNASGNQVISGISQAPWDASDDIYVFKLQNSSEIDPGPISNASGTGLGSMADSSFTIVTSTALSNPVASYAAIQSNGDYYIDHSLGVLWYKTNQATLHLTYHLDYGTWYGAGIVATANAGGSAVSITSSTFDYWGATGSNASGEYTGAAIYTDNKSSPGMTTDRVLTLTGNTFNYDTRPIQIYDLQSDLSHPLTISGNTFNYSRDNQSYLWSDGLMDIGFSSYLTFSGNTFNSFDTIFSGSPRSPFVGIQVKNNTGSVISDAFLPRGAVTSSFENNTLTGYGDTVDSAAFAVGGDAADGPDTYSGNVIGYAERAARLDNYMVVKNNTFYRTYHHGFVFRASDGYISNLTVSNNIIYDSYDTGNFPGGWTLGYNHTQWINNVTVEHNTFNSGTRCINFDDQESTVVLGTNLTIVNNICSNSYQGIYQPANDANNVNFIALTQLDYNDDYNNTGISSNVSQATVARSTTNAAGLTIFNPTAIDAMARTLQLISTGTAGTDLALNASWGGGTPVNFVQDQGTATGGSVTTITDTGKSWTANAWRGYQVIITSGTGAGQYGMVSSNTATQLTIIANNDTSQWGTAAASGSVYVLVKSEVSATDSGSLQTVDLGVYSPSLVVANGTYTDSGITIATHGLSVDPEYVDAASGNFAPTNSALHGVASDGGDIGADAFADTLAPSVTITAPTDGVTVDSTVTLSASSTDNVAVDGVQFQIDGTNFGSRVTATSAPSTYSTTWDTTAATNASHTITAIAYDTSNNSSTASISVTVNNATPNSTPATVVDVPAGGPSITIPQNTTAPSLASSSPAPGAATASLQAAIAALESQLQVLLAEAAQQGIVIPSGSLHAAPAGTVACGTFTRDLTVGNVSTDVHSLQTFLVTQNTGPAARALAAHGTTQTFAKLTLTALKEFQQANGIPATGYFGPITRGKISGASVCASQ